jgi:hypothetical protein
MPFILDGIPIVLPAVDAWPRLLRRHREHCMRGQVPNAEKQLDELIPFALRNNPHLALSALLFSGGVLGLSYGVPAIAGALFGAGATMLGGWITLVNAQRVSAAEKSRRESDAKRYLTPELFRTITRLLFVHQRALANFSCAAFGHEMPKDEKVDFQPIMPVLYPNAPQFLNLPGDDAVALVELYDSLHVLSGTVTDWYGRPHQLPINIFNAILHGVDESLRQAQPCVKLFDNDQVSRPNTFPLEQSRSGSRLRFSKVLRRGTITSSTSKSNKRIGSATISARKWRVGMYWPSTHVGLAASEVAAPPVPSADAAFSLPAPFALSTASLASFLKRVTSSGAMRMASFISLEFASSCQGLP